ncbi:MAG: hypothetical protein PUH35_05385 [Bacteroidales bacterium]|uniref:dual OB domain-containing protein n=1 Tax=Candidatus Cryptobacteroides sp. TaxID=2952915 RepID=UPI002A7594E5|nr:hypothetical protein [Candidatus Cryptobacteroides sp.]MDD7234903.1 hypothetical protein [Bacteroidales bacterium]MDY2702227.1 hypothetical protein [Candidatus Cryptobacteroides sp.]MDY5780840.1 hypothetical protein [Candidatus Cryptobacteroides sp.]
MSKVLIVSRTRMRNNNVCVGGIDVNTGAALRLLNQNGFHEEANTCPYRIRDVWELDYACAIPGRPYPHSEDTIVNSRTKIGVLKHEISMLDFLHRHNNIRIYQGSLLNVFEHKLNVTENGTLFINHDNVPMNSTCFWICDRDINRRDYNGKVRFNYDNNTRRWGYNISWVGEKLNPADTIPAQTLVRLSLANWWAPDDSDIEERCYLQISGTY